MLYTKLSTQKAFKKTLEPVPYEVLSIGTILDFLAKNDDFFAALF